MALNVTSSINLDMKSPNTEVVYGVQYDSAGIIKAQLLNNGTKWTVPNGAKAIVSFKKTDNIGGFYDTTEAGTAAIAYDSDRSIIYIDLDVQTMTTPGKVNMEVNFYQDHRRISTFAFYLMVQKGTVQAADATSSAVFRILSDEIGSIAGAAYLAETVLEEARDAADEVISKANTAVSNVPTNVTNWLNNHITEGNAIDDSLSVEGAAADAKAVGNVLTSGNLVQRIKVKPNEIGTGLGRLRVARSALSLLSNGDVKVTRSSTSSTLSYGVSITVNETAVNDLTGHQLYIKVAGVTASKPSNTSQFRILGYIDGNTGAGITKNFTYSSSNSDFEYIVKINNNINYFLFLLIPESAPADGEYFTFKYAQFIDLTATFGAGYEPSLADFTNVFKEFPYPFVVNGSNLGQKFYQLSQTTGGNTVSIGNQDSLTIKKFIQEMREEWIALRPIPFEKEHGTKRYLEEGPHWGIPYSSIIGLGMDIGFNRNLNTFFSAVKNPASIMYKDNISYGGYQSANYGLVCTTFSGWLFSSPIYYGTRQLSFYKKFKFYDYQGPKSIQIGDCLLTPEDDDGGHIIVIYDIEVFKNNYQVAYIDTIEQAGSTLSYVDDQNMWGRLRRMPVSEFETYLLQNGGRYGIGRYVSDTVRVIDPVRYAEDVIPDMGDRTYYYANDEIFVYIPGNQTTLYYKKKDDENFSTVAISSLATDVVNDTTVYDVTDIISDFDTYELTTNPDNLIYCLVTRIDVGTVTVNGENVQISGYSENIRPHSTETVYLYQGEITTVSRPCHLLGYKYGNVNTSKKLISSDEFTTPVPTQGEAYQVRVWYDTGFGQAFCDSDIIPYT